MTATPARPRTARELTLKPAAALSESEELLEPVELLELALPVDVGLVSELA